MILFRSSFKLHNSLRCWPLQEQINKIIEKGGFSNHKFTFTDKITLFALVKVLIVGLAK